MRRCPYLTVLVAGGLFIASPARAARPGEGVAVARLGGKTPPPAVRVLPPEAPKGTLPVAACPDAEEEAPPSGNPLGDLTGFVKVDFDFAPQEEPAGEPLAPRPKAGRVSAAPAAVSDREAKVATPVDPIVKESAFRRLAQLLDRSAAKKPAPASAAAKESPSPAPKRVAAAPAAKPAPAPSASAKKPAPAPAARLAAGNPKGARRPSLRLPKLPALADLPLLGRLVKREPEPPAKSPAEILSAIRVSATFRKGSAAPDPAVAGESARERAMRLFEAGDYAGSLEPFARAVAEEPGRASLRKYRGLALASLDRHDEAVAELAKAAELDPADDAIRRGLARALAGRGRARLEAGEAKAGRADLERALSLDPACGAAKRALRQAPAGGPADCG